MSEGGLTKLDERVVQLWTHRGLLAVAGIAAAVIGAVVVTFVADGPLLVVLLAGVVVLAPPLWFALWFPKRLYSHWAYRLDEIAVELVHGSIIRKRSVIPYFRVQHVDTQRGPLERPLGLARLKIHTASSGTDATIPGLDDDTATALRAAIVSRAGLGDGV